MSLHKLTAGSGYDYLTRQVAALDATEKGHVGLAAYYTERGESPGVWVGSGMDGIDGLDVGDPVTAEQMRNLFGCGLHPSVDKQRADLRAVEGHARAARGRTLPTGVTTYGEFVVFPMTTRRRGNYALDDHSLSRHASRNSCSRNALSLASRRVSVDA
jgi:hypothetical protein